ncbi:hypothetical protein [Flavisolibacter nicotianae]|uniref:hypothetical protein n=1 Tax=Flavisolibacter nicotianae TaxID=2364882 RepID=UPI0013C4751B|nr:hypothetical protein [Flavisolibacter nicotianae]
MSTSTIIWITVVAVFALLFFLLLKRNKRDRRELEEKLKQDYEKPRPHWDENDIQ